MKILIISLSNLGDAMLTYPAIQGLREAYPGAEFHVLAGPKTRELFSGDPGFHKVWIWEKKASFFTQIGLVLQLMRSGYKLVVDFKNTLIPFVLFGAKRTPFVRRFPPSMIHRADQHLSLIFSVGARPPKSLPRLPYGPEEELKVQGWLNSAGTAPAGGYAAVVPGAKSHLKRWAPEKFAFVADKLSADWNMRILLVGGAEDKTETEAVQRAMKHRAVNLCGATSIRELAALLARISVVITNDTANLHAAQLMGVPTVAVFGPTDEKKYGPRNPNSAVVRRKLVCAPCEKALCAYDHECMRWIEPEEVYSSALKVLGNKSVRAESFDVAQDRLV